MMQVCYPSGTCFHNLPLHVADTTGPVTPNCSDRIRILHPDFLSRRISNTSASVTLWRGWFDPMHVLLGGGLDARFLRMQSLELSLCVPANRWVGFTHNGVSHLWQTKCPSGISPINAIYATLCEYVWLRVGLLRRANTPYPFVEAPVHSQHGPSVVSESGTGPFLSTLAQNLSRCISFIKTRAICGSLSRKCC